MGDPTRLAKSDETLLATIAAGVEGKGMPPFAQVISVDERRDVLAFIRQAFSAKASRAP